MTSNVNDPTEAVKIKAAMQSRVYIVLAKRHALPKSLNTNAIDKASVQGISNNKNTKRLALLEEDEADISDMPAAGSR